VLTPRTQYARSGDVYLAYQVIGEGPYDLVLVLDWASHLEVLWEQPWVVELVSELAKYARVLWFDMRGVGLSDGTGHAAAAPEEWMEDVGAVMDAAGSARATLFANGHASQMALLFAATHPERVTSLVLMNGFARFARGDDFPIGMPPDVRETALDMIEAGWGSGTPGMMRWLAPSIAERPGMHEWWARLERNSATPGAALARMRVSLELDVREILPLIVTPTLVIQSRDNAYVRAGHGRYLAERIAGAELLERDSPDHWPLPEPDLLGAIEEFVTGSRALEHDTDRFLATVLVVDMAGSTEHASEVGDRRWRVDRDRFEHTVRQALLTYGGEFVDAAGDGVLATFDGPARAIRCSVNLRNAIHQSGLEVRCGLHAGEVTRREGGIAGIAVHITARVCALAAPGEVLVTRTVRDLVAGSRISFEERGEHELRGVPDSWALYAANG
jgi:class 3 adenylate cyclase